MCEDGKILHLADGTTILLDNTPTMPVNTKSVEPGVVVPETLVFVKPGSNSDLRMGFERIIED